jgi:hypothetical protein
MTKQLSLLRPLKPALALIALLSLLSCAAAADTDGAFCTAKGYLAYEVRPANAYGVPEHVLHVIRFDAENGIYEAGQVKLDSFQVHGLTCGADRVEISGWGAGFESYSIAVPPPGTKAVAGGSGASALQVLDHHSDAQAKFDPAKDTPEPRWFWHEPLGSYALESVGGDDQYFLVIRGSDKAARDEIAHNRIATVVEKKQGGSILHSLRVYRHARMETID